MIYIAVLALAFVVSIFGVGGGIFYVPLLLGFGLAFHQATNASLLIITVTGLGAFLVFRQERLVDWRLALMLDPLKDVGAFLGGWYSSWFGEVLLSLLFALVLVVGGVMMIRYREGESFTAGAAAGGRSRRVGGKSYSANLFFVLPFCLAAGFFSGLLGIGGGVFMVPLMTLALGVPMKVAVGTSSLMVFLTGVFGFMGGALAGNTSSYTVIVLAIAAFVGALLGPRVAVRLDRDHLRQAFSVLMFVIAAMMAYRGLA